MRTEDGSEVSGQLKSSFLVRRGGVSFGRSFGRVTEGSVYTTEGVHDGTIGKRLLNTYDGPANSRANQRAVGVSVRQYVRHRVLQLSIERVAVTDRAGAQPRWRGRTR